MIKRIYITILCALGKAVDIKSNGKYPANVLSNFWGNNFQYDGVQCKSMEGFLQSLKYDDPEKQRQICQCRGRKAKHKGTERWKVMQQIYWKGQCMDRHGEEYQQLLRSAYQSMFSQNNSFKSALMLTRGRRLYHSIGTNHPYETILTADELCTILTELRDGADSVRRCSRECSRSSCPFRKQ